MNTRGTAKPHARPGSASARHKEGKAPQEVMKELKEKQSAQAS